jgi:hypothetical protein
LSIAENRANRSGIAEAFTYALFLGPGIAGSLGGKLLKKLKKRLMR